MILFFILITSCANAKPPVVIEPKNPKDPQTLPTGLTKNVLVIG
jgi:hypothetical protein